MISLNKTILSYIECTKSVWIQECKTWNLKDLNCKFTKYIYLIFKPVIPLPCIPSHYTTYSYMHLLEFFTRMNSYVNILLKFQDFIWNLSVLMEVINQIWPSIISDNITIVIEQRKSHELFHYRLSLHRKNDIKHINTKSFF